MRPSPAEVTAASDDWVWIPESSTAIETDEYLLVRYPDWFEEPLVLNRLRPRRPAEVVLDEALDRAAGFGLPEVLCWVRPDAHPGLEQALAGRGRLAETVDVLARGVPAAGVPLLPAPAAQLRWVTDVATLRDFDAIGAEVFGGSLPPEELREHEAARAALSFATGAAARVVAYLGDIPVGAAGVSVAEGVARLWGGGVREPYRRRGVYGSMLDARLAWSGEHGAHLALVKGRADTSAPILRRAGFWSYGAEHSYRVPLEGRGD